MGTSGSDSRGSSSNNDLAPKNFNNLQQNTVFYKICKKTIHAAGENKKLVLPLVAKTDNQVKPGYKEADTNSS